MGQAGKTKSQGASTGSQALATESQKEERVLNFEGGPAATPGGRQVGAEQVKQAKKRQAPRVPVRRRVEGGLSDEKVFGFTKDLGFGGMYLRTADVLPAGTELDLQVQLQPDAPPVTVHGQVVRSSNRPDESGMAIAFHTQGKEPERQFIAAFVREMELQLKLEKLDAAKRDFLNQVRQLQEEKIEVERQRLAVSNQETRLLQDVGLQRDDARRLKRTCQEKIEELDARRRDVEATLAAEKRQLAYDREDQARRELQIQELTVALNADQQRLDEERLELRRAVEEERQQLQIDIDRERKLLKHLSVRKEAVKEEQFDKQYTELLQHVASLKHVNEVLETKCHDLEKRIAVMRNESAARTAVYEAHLAQVRAESTGNNHQRQAQYTRLEATIEQLRERLYKKERDIEANQREATRHKAKLEEQTQQAESDLERIKSEVYGLSASRAQLIADLELSQRRRSELETENNALRLELNETKTRLSFRESLFEDLQLRVLELETEREEMESAQYRPNSFGGVSPGGGQQGTVQNPALSDNSEDLPVWERPVIEPKNPFRHK